MCVLSANAVLKNIQSHFVESKDTEPRDLARLQADCVQSVYLLLISIVEFPYL